MKLRHMIIALLTTLSISGCTPRAEAFLIGAGVGAGATCMYLWGNPFCQDGSAYNNRAQMQTVPLWRLHDPYFPDASIPYDMY